MSDLRIDIADDRRTFKPGESLAGRVSWSVNGATSAELRLFFANPQTIDQRTFQFALPHEPYSFSGKLISIIWAIELIIEPGTTVERREFVMSPSGRVAGLP